MRKGLTEKPITSSDQHSICITHAYINGTTWFLKVLYRCVAGHYDWVERSDQRGVRIREAKEKVLKIRLSNHGLVLDSCAKGGTDKTGNSTTGNQGRRFFSEEVLPSLTEIITSDHKDHNNILVLH